MRIGLLQLNPTVGAIADNVAALRDGWEQAKADGAELVVSAELAVCAYAPRDLLDRRPSFDRAVRDGVQALAEATADGPPLVVGAPWQVPDHDGRRLYNAALVLHGGQVQAVCPKTLLPTYDVFDEARWFSPGPGPTVLELAGRRVAVTICEDLWHDAEVFVDAPYDVDPVELLRGRDVDLVLNLSASPFRMHKQPLRRRIALRAAATAGAPVVYVNQVGAHDELVFDGRSFVALPDGRCVHEQPAFETAVRVVDIAAPAPAPAPEPPAEAMVWRALVLGVRDYFRRTGFSKAVLGLSGGIDSALTAAVAVEALGADAVLGIALPSRYSSEGSVTDAQALADNLGMQLETVPIEGMFQATQDALAPLFEGLQPDVTEENMQARARGLVLMSVSNKTGRLLLTTGNKSELAVGYCTLYGDMCGALAVISDLPKTLVYRVCRWFNAERGRDVIPHSTLTKPPSAELAPGQRDDDTLPPYDALDAVLEAYVERRMDATSIAALGYDEALVRRVLRMVDVNEYKRRQAAPGLRVTSKAFGMGRRMPIAARFV